MTNNENRARGSVPYTIAPTVSHSLWSFPPDRSVDNVNLPWRCNATVFPSKVPGKPPNYVVEWGHGSVAGAGVELVPGFSYCRFSQEALFWDADHFNCEGHIAFVRHPNAPHKDILSEVRFVTGIHNMTDDIVSGAFSARRLDFYDDGMADGSGVQFVLATLDGRTTTDRNLRLNLSRVVQTVTGPTSDVTYAFSLQDSSIQFLVGLDKSDGGRFKITKGGSLGESDGANDVMVIDPATNCTYFRSGVTIGHGKAAPSTGGSLRLDQTNANGSAWVELSNGKQTNYIYTDTTANAGRLVIDAQANNIQLNTTGEIKLTATGKIRVDSTGVGFNGNNPVPKLKIVGSCSDGTALKDLISKLARRGDFEDGTTA